ncbi:hypothetical protein DPMN_071481 [Dreissena polymorpha]|uniref:Secreted protein n=1 Tax=Dreissena polymorpha TaxID=45954 RepID=A0A9D3Z7K1_DREPO|nr:hypothetical protein DPMN_071481 [Dreissena polymorpha]
MHLSAVYRLQESIMAFREQHTLSRFVLRLTLFLLTVKQVVASHTSCRNNSFWPCSCECYENTTPLFIVDCSSQSLNEDSIL